MRQLRPPHGGFALLPAALFCAACLVVGQDQPAGGDAAGECPSVVFPPAGFVLGEHDPSHVTVAVPAGCGIVAGGGRLELLVNGEAIEEWRVEPGSDFTESAMLFRLRWGTNAIQLLLYSDGSEASLRQTTSTFEVTGAFLTTSFCEHVMAWEGEESSGGGENGDGAGPWTLDGRPFLRRHAQVWSFVSKPDLLCRLLRSVLTLSLQVCAARPSVTVTWPPEGCVPSLHFGAPSLAAPDVPFCGRQDMTRCFPPPDEARTNLISQKVFIKSFCKDSFPHKSVNLFVIGQFPPDGRLRCLFVLI